MPNTREKLIELLKSGGVRDFPFNAALADHLIANGVGLREQDCHWATEQAHKNGYKQGIKDFAENLKKYKYQSSDWSHGEHPFVVEESDIDELVEEMVGA